MLSRWQTADRTAPGRNGPILGHALKIANAPRQISWVGSPREIVGEAEFQAIDLEELINDGPTTIDALEVLMLAPKIQISGGPHAERILDLLEAVGQGDISRIESAVASSPEVLTEGSGCSLPLIKAAWLGYSPSISALIRFGAAVDGLGHFDMSALHWAAAMGWSEAVVTLLASGANAELRSWFAVSPLDLAAINRQRGAATALRKSGAAELEYSVHALIQRTLTLWRSAARQ